MPAQYSSVNMREVIKSGAKLMAKTAVLKLGKSFIKRSGTATIGAAAAFGVGYYVYKALNSRK